MGLVLPPIEAYQVQHLPIVKAYADKIGRSISRSLSKGEGDRHGHEKRSKRCASLLAMGSGTARRDVVSLPDVTRYKV